MMGVRVSKLVKGPPTIPRSELHESLTTLEYIGSASVTASHLAPGYSYITRLPNYPNGYTNIATYLARIVSVSPFLFGPPFSLTAAVRRNQPCCRSSKQKDAATSGSDGGEMLSRKKVSFS